jgi:hypothetical protein
MLALIFFIISATDILRLRRNNLINLAPSARPTFNLISAYLINATNACI